MGARERLRANRSMGCPTGCPAGAGHGSERAPVGADRHDPQRGALSSSSPRRCARSPHGATAHRAMTEPPAAVAHELHGRWDDQPSRDQREQHGQRQPSPNSLISRTSSSVNDVNTTIMDRRSGRDHLGRGRQPVCHRGGRIAGPEVLLADPRERRPRSPSTARTRRRTHMTRGQVTRRMSLTQDAIGECFYRGNVEP